MQVHVSRAVTGKPPVPIPSQSKCYFSMPLLLVLWDLGFVYFCSGVFLFAISVLCYELKEDYAFCIIYCQAMKGLFRCKEFTLWQTLMPDKQ